VQTALIVARLRGRKPPGGETESIIQRGRDMPKSRKSAAIGMAMMCLAAGLLAQETIPDRVQRSNRDFNNQVLPNWIPLDVRTATRQADLVIRGRVLGGKSVLSRDQKRVETEYKVEVEEVLKPAVSPNQKGTLNVSREGGELLVDKHRVTEEVSHFPFCVVGHEYVFFLRLDPNSLTYQFGGPFNVYEVNGTTIRTLEDFAQLNRQYNHMQLAEFSKRVKEAASAKGAD
jgi:hypothetical protein